MDVDFTLITGAYIVAEMGTSRHVASSAFFQTQPWSTRFMRKRRHSFYPESVGKIATSRFHLIIILPFYLCTYIFFKLVERRHIFLYAFFLLQAEGAAPA